MIADPALIVVDLQNDFSKPGYAVGVPHMQSALDAAGEFLQRYRASGRTPILVRTVHGDDVDASGWLAKYEAEDRARPCERGTAGAEFVPELGVTEDDVVVTKHRYDAFFETDLETYLRANGVSAVLICGIGTNVCVESTVRSAFDRDYDVTVLADCCSTTQTEYEVACLENMDRFFGEVAESGDIDLEPLPGAAAA